MICLRCLLVATLSLVATPTAQPQTVAAPAGRPPSVVGGTSSYVVRSGDTVTSIAAKHGVTSESIAARNGLARNRKLDVGQTLLIDNRHLAVLVPGVSLTINIAQRMLFYAEDNEVRGYPITVGARGWPTPVGAFTIVTKETDPTWDVPVSIQREMAAEGKPVVTSVAPSPQNPLGARWLGLSLPGLGIHGTNAPSSIYRYASHGCIRMHPDHILELFERVNVGTSGILIYEPVVMAVIDGRVWLEVHPDPYGRVTNPMIRARTIAASLGATETIEWTAVEAALRRRDGGAEDVTRRIPQ